VLKEKFKLLKGALRLWHNNHFKNLPCRITSLKDRLSLLDEKGEVSMLSETEIDEVHTISDELHSLSRAHTSISWQQSRMNWLREGDANSKFFHGIMSSRRRGNAISSILVDGALVEGVTHVREVVFSHFSAHFKAVYEDRSTVDNLTFRTLSHADGVELIQPFCVEEVKAAIWDCDSNKAPGPNGISFGFLKEFWPELEHDFMRFLMEFHRNGKLIKGINCTFIALIPKIDNPIRLNDFRPISLVGSMYKVLAKVLANTLRKVIGKVVSPT
jgi:hypothetical protein